MQELSKKVVLGVRDERRVHLSRTSFWIPEVAPTAEASAIAKVTAARTVPPARMID